jgi:Zn-dependent protease
MTQEQWLLLPVWYAVFLLSVTCHEAAHAVAARIGGDETAYHGGQASLNPLPHVRREPFGTVLLPLLSYIYFGLNDPGTRWMVGWASAPYDPVWEDRHPRRAALMAAAGPLANLLLAILGLTLLKAGLSNGLWVPFTDGAGPELDRLVAPATLQAHALEGLGRFCSVLASLNVVLFLFNLIPLPPMDGASIVAGSFRAARALRERLRASSLASLVGLVAAWYLFGYVFWPVYVPMLIWLYR